MTKKNLPAIRPSNHVSVKQYPPLTEKMFATLRFDRKYGPLRYRRLFAYFHSNRIKIIQPFLIFFLSEGLGLRFVLGEVDWNSVRTLDDLLKSQVAISNGYMPIWQLLIFVQLGCFGIIALTSFSVLVAWLRLGEVAREISSCRAVPVRIKYIGDDGMFKMFEVESEADVSVLKRIKRFGFAKQMIEGDVDKLRDEFAEDTWIEGSLLTTSGDKAYVFVTDKTALWIPRWHNDGATAGEVRFVS